VEEPNLALERQLVAEPLGLLVGVDVASHPCQERRVVHDLAVRRVEAHVVGQAQGDEGLAQHVLHGLAHAQIGGQRQHGQELSQANARRWNELRHET